MGQDALVAFLLNSPLVNSIALSGIKMLGIPTFWNNESTRHVSWPGDISLTETPVDSAYSSVVSLRGIRMLAFLGELNGLKVWSTDIGNAYLETYTKEKACIIAGPEFGD